MDICCGSEGQAHESKSLMKSIEQRIPVEPGSRWSIYKVPNRLRKLNRAAYSPQFISIGPIHWGKANLQEMEAHKTLYMHSLLRRTTEASTSMAKCGDVILGLKEDARHCYAENSGTNKRLAEILLVDGCFILELFLRYSEMYFSRNDPLSESGSRDWSRDDPIFQSAWMIYALRRDLLLLENQIPFSVLKGLFNHIVNLSRKEHRPSYSLTKCALIFFRPVLHFERAAVEGAVNKIDGSDEDVMHLLDLIHKYYQPSSIPESPKTKGNSLERIQGATKLKEAGIIFRKKESHDLFDIDFTNTTGALEIPQLCIEDATESLFRNLIAFEQCFGVCEQHITSYAILMDRLINTTRDAELLEEKEIIINLLGHSGDVCRLFNNLCKEVVLEDFFFKKQCEKIGEYDAPCWRRNKAILKRDYCSNPCRFISFVAAAVLLLLTIFQTAYTIASYYPR